MRQLAAAARRGCAPVSAQQQQLLDTLKGLQMDEPVPGSLIHERLMQLADHSPTSGRRAGNSTRGIEAYKVQAGEGAGAYPARRRWSPGLLRILCQLGRADRRPIRGEGLRGGGG